MNHLNSQFLAEIKNELNTNNANIVKNEIQNAQNKNHDLAYPKPSEFTSREQNLKKNLLWKSKTSYELPAQIHEFWVQIRKLRVQIHKLED